MKRFSILVLLLVTGFGQVSWSAEELTAESLLVEPAVPKYTDWEIRERRLEYGEWGNKCPYVELDAKIGLVPNGGSIVCPGEAECIIPKYQVTAKCYCSQIDGCGEKVQ